MDVVPSTSDDEQNVESALKSLEPEPETDAPSPPQPESQPERPPTPPPLPVLERPDLILAFNSTKGGGDVNGYSLNSIESGHLAFLGKSLVPFAVSASLYESRPKLAATKLTRLRNAYTDTKSLSRWAELYGRFGLPAAGDAEPSAALFTAYAGALYLQNGATAVQDWITSLITYSEIRNAAEAAAHAGEDNGSKAKPGRKRTTPPSEETGPSAEKRAKINQGENYLLVLNTRASIKRIPVTWDVQSASDDPRKPMWIAILTIPSLDIFEKAIAQNKRTAKEEASKNACLRLGWNLEKAP